MVSGCSTCGNKNPTPKWRKEMSAKSLSWSQGYKRRNIWLWREENQVDLSSLTVTDTSETPTAASGSQHTEAIKQQCFSIWAGLVLQEIKSSSVGKWRLQEAGIGTSLLEKLFFNPLQISSGESSFACSLLLGINLMFILISIVLFPETFPWLQCYLYCFCSQRNLFCIKKIKESTN